MATAGMGDVLSGIIAGFAAQRIPLNDAAKLGVLVHAMNLKETTSQKEVGIALNFLDAAIDYIDINSELAG